MNNSVESLEFAFFAPAGFYIALRIGFAFPSEEHNAMPPRWIDRYTARGYMLYDPVIKWIYENTGATRWSETGLDDPRGVMAEARDHGLNFGVAICCADSGEEGQRSFGSFARSDREYDEAEIRILSARMQQLHTTRRPPSNLTNAELEALRMVKNGLLLKQIAAELGVSDGAVKQRLKNARLKLNAKTGTQAASMATAFGLI